MRSPLRQRLTRWAHAALPQPGERSRWRGGRSPGHTDKLRQACLSSPFGVHVHGPPRGAATPAIPAVGRRGRDNAGSTVSFSVRRTLLPFGLRRSALAERRGLAASPRAADSGPSHGGGEWISYDTLSLRAAHGQMVRLAAARACSKYSSAFATLCSGCRLRRCSAMHRRTGQGSRSCLIAASVGGNYFEIESSDRINVGCWAIRRDPAQSPDGRGIARPANGGRKPINTNCETVEGLPPSGTPIGDAVACSRSIASSNGKRSRGKKQSSPMPSP